MYCRLIFGRSQKPLSKKREEMQNRGTQMQMRSVFTAEDQDKVRRPDGTLAVTFRVGHQPSDGSIHRLKMGGGAHRQPLKRGSQG